MAARAAGGAAGAPQRASELSRVAISVYEAGGRGIHVPLSGDHPLVSVIAAALLSVKEEGAPGGRGAGGHKGGGAVRKGAAEVAEALLDQIVQLQAAGEGGDEEEGGAPRFAALLALHALAAAEPALVAPPRDPQRFVRALAPYATPPDVDTIKRQSGAFGAWPPAAHAQFHL